MTECLALGIETATSAMGAALADESGPLGEVTVARGRRHAETLHPAIAHLLAQLDLTMGSIAVVAVDIGPGLFTGLRVGLSAAKALAAGLGVPLVSATSLELLAAGAAPLAGELEVVPVVDMRRGEVAWQCGGPIELGAPQLLAESLAGRPGRAFLVGDGAQRHRQLLGAGCEPAPLFGGEALASPSARLLASGAFERLERQGPADVAAIVPLYLRQADAAINWETRHGREVPA